MSDGIRGARSGDEDEIVLPRGRGGEEGISDGGDGDVMLMASELRVDCFDVDASSAKVGC
jgi:hypothetical protein